MALEEKIAQITLVDRGLLEKESNIGYHDFPFQRDWRRFLEGRPEVRPLFLSTEW